MNKYFIIVALTISVSFAGAPQNVDAQQVKQVCKRNQRTMPCFVSWISALSEPGYISVTYVDQNNYHFRFGGANHVYIRTNDDNHWKHGLFEWGDPGVFMIYEVTGDDGNYWRFPRPVNWKAMEKDQQR